MPPFHSLFVTILITFVTFSAVASGQVVTKVKDGQAWVNIEPSQAFAQDETVHFLNDSLKRVASGVINTISDGRSAMIVQLTEGSPSIGMKVEKDISKAAPAPAVLSEEERKTLDIGEISTTRYVIGGVIGTYPIGLGVGHAIQGRYGDKGWIFTVGELGSMAVLLAGLGDCTFDDWSDDDDCDGGGLIFLGAAGYVGFRIWEVIDVWAGSAEHNRRYREIRARQGQSTAQWKGFLAPTLDGGKFVLQYSF